MNYIIINTVFGPLKTRNLPKGNNEFVDKNPKVLLFSTFLILAVSLRGLIPRTIFILVFDFLCKAFVMASSVP